jgi:hypothetical protein
MELEFKETYDTVNVPLIQAPQYTEDSTQFWTQDQIYINAFPLITKNSLSGDKDGWIVKRPGSGRVGVNVQSLMTGSSNYWCMDNIAVTALTDVYVCAMMDETLSKVVICQYRVNAGTTVKIGEITGAFSGDRVHITELTIANVPYIGVTWCASGGGSSKGFYAASSGGVFTASSLTEITDVDFPPKRGSPVQLAGAFVQMNGTTYVMTVTGEIAGSDLNSITSWNSLNTLQAISYPDQGVGLIRYKGHIVAFGEDSMEFFVDVGNPSPVSPLQRMEEVFIKFGAVNSLGIISIEDTLYWLGRSSTGQVGFFKLDGYNVVKISGSYEDAAIAQANTSTYANQGKLSCITFFGHKHIFIGGSIYRAAYPYQGTFTGDPRGIDSTGDFRATLVYNADEGIFWGWTCRFGSGGSPNGYAFPIATSPFLSANVQAANQIFLLSNGGASFHSSVMGMVYSVNPANYVWTDDQQSGTGNAYTVTIQVNQMRFGNEKKKRIHKIKAIFETLYSDSVEADSGSYLWFAYGKEDWVPFTSLSKMRSISIPNSIYRYYVSNLGSCRSLGLALVSRNKMSMKLRTIELDVSQGV